MGGWGYARRLRPAAERRREARPPRAGGPGAQSSVERVRGDFGALLVVLLPEFHGPDVRGDEDDAAEKRAQRAGDERRGQRLEEQHGGVCGRAKEDGASAPGLRTSPQTGPGPPEAVSSAGGERRARALRACVAPCGALGGTRPPGRVSPPRIIPVRTQRPRCDSWQRLNVSGLTTMVSFHWDIVSGTKHILASFLEY